MSRYDTQTPSSGLKFRAPSLDLAGYGWVGSASYDPATANIKPIWPTMNGKELLQGYPSYSLFQRHSASSKSLSVIL